MRNNSVIIATNANFLAEVLGEKLRDAGFHIVMAATDNELLAKMKVVSPRFIFLEYCFHGHETDVFIQQLTRNSRDLRIAVWAASEVNPSAAARLIAAGAESFFSLRETNKNLEIILYRIASGRHYYPVDVAAELDKDRDYSAIGEELTERELAIIKLSIKGKSNQQIADALSLTIYTVKFHKASIYRKCGGNTSLDILRNGLIQGIIHPEDLG